MIVRDANVVPCGRDFVGFFPVKLIARTFRVCVKGNAKQTVAFAVDFLVFTQAIACLRAHSNPILAALRGKEIAGRLLVRQGNIAAVDDPRPRFGGIALLEKPALRAVGAAPHGQKLRQLLTRLRVASHDEQRCLILDLKRP